MVRVGVSVEGLTEVRFFELLIAPYFASKDMFITTVSIGGNISIPRIEKDLQKLVYNFDYISTFYDFYGFKGKDDHETKTSLELKIQSLIDEGLQRKLIPYIQMYEFEGLLFTSPDAIATELQDKSLASWAFQILQEFENQPEKINNSVLTAPSKRLEKTNYKKTTHGPNIAQRIGLEKIRTMCPGFNEWVAKLESLT